MYANQNKNINKVQKNINTTKMNTKAMFKHNNK
jgi:hypothetical protein